MPPIKKDKLEQWYKNFSRILYENVYIDLTRPEDLGRVKNITVVAWKEDTPIAPAVESRYVFVPHNEQGYLDAEPSKLEINDHNEWLVNNLTVDASVEKMQELYEMSRAGTLMVSAPGVGVNFMQQVRTDENGNITLSLPMVRYQGENNEKLPEEQRAPKDPVYVEEPNPRDFGAPEPPVAPVNQNPGFFSWLGYKLHLNTDYAKLMKYREDYINYSNEMATWLSGGSEEAKQYQEQTLKRQEFLEYFDSYKKDPLGKANALCTGYSSTLFMGGDEMGDDEAEVKIYDEQDAEVDEMYFLADQHAKLPQGKYQIELNAVEEKLQYADRTRQVLRHMLGADTNLNALVEWGKRGVLDLGKMNPKKYTLPVDKKLPEAEQNAQKEKLKKLWRVAGFAALSDPNVVGEPLEAGCTVEESAALHYGKCLYNLVTTGVENCEREAGYIEIARAKANEAMEQYAAGNAEPLAKLIANSVRTTNREAAALENADSAHAMNTSYLCGVLLETLENDPALLEKSGLSREELEQTRVNAELGKVMRQGLEGKKMLLENALYKRDLTEQEKMNAGRDVLFSHVVSGEVEKEYRKWMMNKMPGIVVGGDGKSRDDQIKLTNLNRPGSPFRAKLLDENWVEKAKADLEKDSALKDMRGKSREELGRIFSSKEEAIKSFGGKAVVQADVNEEIKEYRAMLKGTTAAKSDAGKNLNK